MSKRDRSASSGVGPLAGAIFILLCGIGMVVYGQILVGDHEALKIVTYSGTALTYLGWIVIIPACVATAWLAVPRYRENLTARRWLGKGGWARGHDIRRALGRPHARKMVKTTRPVYSAAARFFRRHPLSELGVFLGNAVVGSVRWPAIIASAEDTIVKIAAPRSGKTATMTVDVIEAPGAAVVTSSRVDIIKTTQKLRGQLGPTYIMNPNGMGKLPTTLHWDPVQGCEDPARALIIAAYMVNAANGPNDQASSTEAFFDNYASVLMRSFLMAAAIGGYGLDKVHDWSGRPTDSQALTILEEAAARPGSTVPDGWPGDLESIMRLPERTRDSVYATLKKELVFMADPVAKAAVLVPEGEKPFDVREFIASRGTLYLVGAEKPGASAGALFSALAGFIWEEAKMMAAECQGDRLDPPMMWALDEAGIVAPLPLHLWTSEAGGWGMTLIMSFQSLSQITDRWGRHGADTIMNNATVKWILGGLSVPEHLEWISSLVGNRTVTDKSTTTGADGKESKTTTSRTERTLPPEKVRLLPKWYSLVIFSNKQATVVRTKPYFRHRGIRQRMRQLRIDTARLAAEAKAADAQRADATLADAVEPAREEVTSP